MKIGFNEANDRFCKDHSVMKDLEYCEKCGVKIHYEEMPGAHEWKVWDEMIVRFLDWRK